MRKLCNGHWKHLRSKQLFLSLPTAAAPCEDSPDLFVVVYSERHCLSDAVRGHSLRFVLAGYHQSKISAHAEALRLHFFAHCLPCLRFTLRVSQLEVDLSDIVAELQKLPEIEVLCEFK